METILKPFKKLVNWISSKMKKDGTQRTVLSVVLGLIVVVVIVVIMVIVVMLQLPGRIIHGVGEEMESSKIEQFEEHRDLWIESRELYGKLKTLLKEERPLTGADQILFIEYHNGSENIATGYQFCKFDVSMSVRSDTTPAIYLEDFRDENIWKWDVLLNDKLTHQKISTFLVDDLRSIDEDIDDKFRPNQNIECVVFYNIMCNNVCAGTLMFIYKSFELIDYGAVVSCGTNMENIINSAMKER